MPFRYMYRQEYLVPPLGELSSDSETKGGNTLIRYTIILPQSPGIDKNNEASYNFSIRSYN